MNRRGFFSFLGAVVIAPAALLPLCQRRTDPPQKRKRAFWKNWTMSYKNVDKDELVEKMRRASANMEASAKMEWQPPGAVPRGIEYWLNQT